MELWADGKSKSQSDIWNARFSNPSNRMHSDEELAWVMKHEHYFVQRKDSIIVDLGCGSGANALYLHDKGYMVIACDFAENALASIRAINSAIETRCFDMTQGLGLPTESVGVILASLSTHYFSYQDTEMVYAGVREALESSGYFILRVNSLQEYENRDQAHIVETLEKDFYRLDDGTTKRYFSVQTLCELLKDFHVLSINEEFSIYHGRVKHYIEAVVQKRSGG